MSVVDLVIARVTDPDSPSYEGFESDAYDDATGKPVVTKGYPTVGYGSMVCQWSKARALNDIQWVLTNLLDQIVRMPWYRGSDNRKSVLLEVAFNQGLGGLLHYPHMLAACAMDNFAQAANECTIRDIRLKARYAALAEIMRAG